MGEFLLRRYCSSTGEAEIQEGLDIVQRWLASRTVCAGEEDLFKARAKEQGRVKLIDLITARLDSKNDSFVAELPGLRLKEVRLQTRCPGYHGPRAGCFQLRAVAGLPVAQCRVGVPVRRGLLRRGLGHQLRPEGRGQHHYMPGWDIPKVNLDQLADHFGRRIGSAEFRNTHFSFQMGMDGVEQFVSTPELQSEDSIGDDPLPPGQVWVLSPGGLEEHPGLYRLDVIQGPGSGVKILNQPPPAPFKESLRCAEQNLYTRAKTLVGDRDPRAHEFSVQLRAFDAGKSGSATGVGALLALCSALLEKSLKGGLIVVGGLNLGGSIEPVYNVVSVVEAAADKGAKTILLPVTTRRQLIELDDEIATRVTVVFYSDARDALLKALIE